MDTHDEQDARTRDGVPSPHRRTVLKGAAWSIPVIASAAAVPAYAASPTCVGGTFSISGTGNTHAMQSVTLPACARTVTYTVIGGSGGSLNGDSPTAGPGGGAVITGTLLVSGGETLTLVAGGGGLGGGYASTLFPPVPTVVATGFGSGGLGGNVGGRMVGSGGGAGSALLLGPGWTGVDNPLAVAGGGGGSYASTTLSGNPGPYFRTWLETPVLGHGGSPGLPGGAGLLIEQWPNADATHVAGGGGGATSTSPGVGGTWTLGAGASTSIPVSGANGNPGNGHEAGHGTISPVFDNGNGGHAAASGGGGGGWFGGGSGATVWASGSNHAAMSGHGGGGSSYYGGSTPAASAANGSVTIPYPTSISVVPSPRTTRHRYPDPMYPLTTFDGLPGSVTVSWS